MAACCWSYFFLVLVIRKSEPLYNGYSKVLLGLSLMAPLSLGLLSIPAVGQGASALGWICTGRLFGSPVMILGLLVSRLLARSATAKRCTLYALGIEVLTLMLAIALVFFAGKTH